MDHKQLQPQNVRLREDREAVVILDQTRLPGKTVYLDLCTAGEMFEAIEQLRVRGAPAIGICAAFSLYVLARRIPDKGYHAFCRELHQLKNYLGASRPTAVNLSWALNRMEAVVAANPGKTAEELLALLEAESIRIQQEDIQMCRSIAGYGLSLMREGCGVLTHCNAGPLATSLYGTAQGAFFLAKEQGMRFKVFVDETRPLLQGARLTAYELHQAGVDVTLICDNMASMVMKNGWVDMCFVGCDRIAANGDTANKIGTSGVAVLAKHYGIPLYVLGPTSTIDLDCATGDDIVIELRDGDEIREKYYQEPMAPKGVQCYNPAFDVTDHSLITGIVTQHGISYPPYTQSLKELFVEQQPSVGS